MKLEDRALRQNDIFGPRLRIRTNDLKRPNATMPHPDGDWRNWSPDGPIRILFNERVTGVNARSLPVVRRDGLYWSTPLAGTLTCRNGTGTKVSCGSTRIREVRWHPDAGVLEPGKEYAVLPNPDGVLDIRDRAGNPARRSEKTFGTIDQQATNGRG